MPNFTEFTLILGLLFHGFAATASVPFDAEILEQFAREPKVVVRLILKPTIDLETLDATERRNLDELERANPGSLATPGFVSHILLRGALAAAGDRAWSTFWDLTGRPRLELNRFAFARLIAGGDAFLERVEVDPKRCDVTIIQ